MAMQAEAATRPARRAHRITDIAFKESLTLPINLRHKDVLSSNIKMLWSWARPLDGRYRLVRQHHVDTLTTCEL